MATHRWLVYPSRRTLDWERHWPSLRPTSGPVVGTQPLRQPTTRLLSDVKTHSQDIEESWEGSGSPASRLTPRGPARQRQSTTQDGPVQGLSLPLLRVPLYTPITGSHSSSRPPTAFLPPFPNSIFAHGRWEFEAVVSHTNPRPPQQVGTLNDHRRHIGHINSHVRSPCPTSPTRCSTPSLRQTS